MQTPFRPVNRVRRPTGPRITRAVTRAVAAAESQRVMHMSASELRRATAIKPRCAMDWTGRHPRPLSHD